MKKIYLITITSIIILTLTSCSQSNEKTQITEIQETQEIEKNQEILETQPPIVTPESIMDYRDSFKDDKIPSLEEIGEENISEFLFQYLNKDIHHGFGNCFCHM